MAIFVKLDGAGSIISFKHDCPSVEEFSQGWASCRDLKTFDEARRIADNLSALTGTAYLPVDGGEYVYPRFDVIAAPKIGDPVSIKFNGDYYPAGVIEKITKGWRITTSTGSRFRRNKLTASWNETGTCYAMVSGHHNKRNLDI